MKQMAWGAKFRLDIDISPLFPYVNSVVDDAMYFDTPHYIQFFYDGYWCTLYPEEILIASFKDREQALIFFDHFTGFLNDIFSRKDTIEPNYRIYNPLPVLDIFKILPRTNCRKCGFKTCMAFAGALSKSKTVPERCPFLKPKYMKAVYPVFNKGGKVISELEIDIDPENFKLDFKKQNEYVEQLEARISDLTEKEKGNNRSPDTGDDLIRVNLSARETEVLCLLAEGGTNTEIAEILSISPHTVKSHVIHIFNKLGVNDRTQAAVWAARHNLV